MKGKRAAGVCYGQADLTVAARLPEEPYLTTGPKHNGLLPSSYDRLTG